MTTPTDPAPLMPPPVLPPSPPRRSHGKQIALLIVGGIMLAFGGCALFIATIQRSDNLSGFFGLLFVVGVVMVLSGIVYAIVRGLSRKK